MPKLPPIKDKKLIKILLTLGFVEKRQKGSHRFFYRNSDKTAVVVPIHNKEIGKGLLHKIIKDVGITIEELIHLL